MLPGVEIPPIAPLPDSAIDLPPAVAAVEVTPAPGTYPHRSIARQPFTVGVRAFAPAATPPLGGVLRWRKTLSPRWEELPLLALGKNTFSVEWSPASPGDYEWCVELWAGSDALKRHGSSGADVLQRLRVERSDIGGARWLSAPRVPFAELHAALRQDIDLLLLAPIFPQDATGLTGKDEVGHYSIDPALGDTRDFGDLAAAARASGTALALTVPLECSPAHPMRQRHPAAFGDAPTADLTGEGWRELWAGWEAVFRFWLVQGIDIFHVPRPGTAPASFWQTLLSNLRDDFPATVFTAPAADLAAFGEHLTGAGFIAAPALEPELEEGNDGEEAPLGLLDDAPELAIEIAKDPAQSPTPTVPPDRSHACSCSNPALEIRIEQRGDGFVLQVENRAPASAQSGHVHLAPTELGLGEHDRYYLRDLADGRAYRWSGSTNFLSLAAGETAKTFRIERN